MFETYGWLTYYFYKAVFMTAVKLPFYILQHRGMHKAKIILV